MCAARLVGTAPCIEEQTWTLQNMARLILRVLLNSSMSSDSMHTSPSCWTAVMVLMREQTGPNSVVCIINMAPTQWEDAPALQTMLRVFSVSDILVRVHVLCGLQGDAYHGFRQVWIPSSMSNPVFDRSLNRSYPALAPFVTQFRCARSSRNRSSQA